MINNTLGQSSEFDWSCFWNRPGQLTAFRNHALASDYDQSEIRVLLESLISELSDGDRVLDLAGGNGAVSQSLFAAADRIHREIAINSIDSAVVSPPPDLTQRVTFVQTTAEQLPFPPETFQLAISFFGVEFCQRFETLREVFRVLTAEGNAAFLIYAVESPLISRISDLLHVSDNGLQQLIDSVRTLPAGGTPAEQMTVCHRYVDQVRIVIEDQIAQPLIRKQLLNFVAQLSDLIPNFQLLNNMYALEQLHSAVVSAFLEELRWKRLIRQAALNSGQVRQIIRDAERVGFTDTYVVPFEFERQLLGWLWRGTK